jgi:multimeric flavodoxin WrbA
MTNKIYKHEKKKKSESNTGRRCLVKLLAICGSPRKGNSYNSLKEIGEAFPHIDYEILHLKDLEFSFCKGCYGCVTRGEEICPLKDERDSITGKMMEADGVIFASPVYSHMVSGPMKKFFDRYGYLAYRPRFFDKYAMSMVSCSGYGAEDALKYMDKMLSVFGFNLAPSLELHFRPGNMPAENKMKNTEKLKLAVSKLISRIEKGEKDKPSLSMMIPFNIFKYVSILDKETMKADYAYYKDKEDYYYETKIPFYKKYIAKKVSDKIVSQFDYTEAIHPMPFRN